MARKPRELWCASYLFSSLMEKIIEAILDKKNILSPAIGVTDKSVGLFPDRLFYKSDQGIEYFVEHIINPAKAKFSTERPIPLEYFNTYAVEVIAENDKEAIWLLNKKLDFLELHNVAFNKKGERDHSEVIRDFIFDKKNSEQIKTETLIEVATAQLKILSEERRLSEGNNYASYLNEFKRKNDDKQFIQNLKSAFNTFPDKFIPPHKYICVVHADGDNIGKAVTTVEGDQLKSLSQSLLNFGTKACESIRQFNGIPIYAGGDDLLFIAPVISKIKEKEKQTIFDLINTLDMIFHDEVLKGLREENIKWIDRDGNEFNEPSMSFGVSITYHKYPLYEALSMSRDLLFEKAKHVIGKNAIAWALQKNSGSIVKGQFSKTRIKDEKEPDGIHVLFSALLDAIDSLGAEKTETAISERDAMEAQKKEKKENHFISLVPHKIKANEALLRTLVDEKTKTINPTRLAAFFDHILERETKNKKQQTFLTAVENLLCALFDSLIEENENYKKKKPEKVKSIEEIISDTVHTTYGILRTAKFIKGLEDDKDE